MMGHKICFHGEIWLIIPKLSLLTLLIRSTESLRKIKQLFSANSDGFLSSNRFRKIRTLYLMIHTKKKRQNCDIIGVINPGTYLQYLTDAK